MSDYPWIRIRHPYDEPKIVKVRFVDEGWKGCPLYVFGHEYGPTHMICAPNESDAYGIWLDVQPTISHDDLDDAYGFSCRASYNLYCRLRDDENNDVNLMLARKLGELEEVSFDSSDVESWPNLVEGYDYQPNASGTGIVDVGHYLWWRQVAVRKS